MEYVDDYMKQFGNRMKQFDVCMKLIVD